MMVLHGWSPEAQSMLHAGKADFLSGLAYDGTLFKRSNDRKAPHNSYITFENILKGLDDKGYELEGQLEPLVFLEKDDNQLEGKEATNISVRYYRYEVGFVFDEQSGIYHRFNGESKTVDHETGKELEVANILVAEMDHKILDDVGRRAINLTSGGQAMLFQNGHAQEVEWVNENGRIIAVKDGEPVPLKQGQTWINILPSSPGLDESVTY
jgi:hypothetical protein